MFIPSVTEEERKLAKMEKRNQANSSFIMKQPEITKNYHHNHQDHSILYSDLVSRCSQHSPGD